jgi:hypothetical protein
MPILAIPFAHFPSLFSDPKSHVEVACDFGCKIDLPAPHGLTGQFNGQTKWARSPAWVVEGGSTETYASTHASSICVAWVIRKKYNICSLSHLMVQFLHGITDCIRTPMATPPSPHSCPEGVHACVDAYVSVSRTHARLNTEIPLHLSTTSLFLNLGNLQLEISNALLTSVRFSAG